MKNFFEINRALAAKKHFFHSFILSLFTSALLLGMASCGDGNNPEPEPEPEPEVKIPEGAINGKFTVEAGKQVYFSKSNLCFDGEIGMYCFFDNQWDYIGDKADYSDIHGKFDLFGWGTGTDPLKTSTDPEDYPFFSEWGYNKIINGGETEGQWRTLTGDQWNYLFRERNDATKLFGFGVIVLPDEDQVPGIIILPDDFDAAKREQFHFTSAYANEVVWVSDIPQVIDGYYPKGASLWDEHNYYAVDVTEDYPYAWSDLEKEGAVFLPMASARSGEEFEVFPTGGYWASTPFYDDEGQLYEAVADDLIFASDQLLVTYGSDRSIGASVRLVRDVK